MISKKLSSRPLRENLYANPIHPKIEKVVDKVMYYPMEDLFFELQQELESILIALE